MLGRNQTHMVNGLKLEPKIHSDHLEDELGYSPEFFEKLGDIIKSAGLS
jgi:hypothetical protein